MNNASISHQGWAAVTLFALCCLFTTAYASSEGGNAAKGGGPQLDTPVSAEVMQALKKASQAGLGTDSKPASMPLKSISGPPVAGIKPGVLYMGADFCPFCASLRWPLVLALLRFGEFTDLKYMRSSAHDTYANTITFSFHSAGYNSPYLVFQAVELADRAGKRLEKPQKHQLNIFKKYDDRPYTSSPGAIPFLYVGGRYLENGAPFSPKLLKDLTWQAAAKQIGNEDSTLSQHVLAVTNLYTAAFCQLTRGNPSRICKAPAVKTAKSHLPGPSQSKP